MLRTILLSGLVAFALACGGSSPSPVGPLDGPEIGAPAVSAEIDQTDARIAASEIGAAGVVFDLEEGQRQAIDDALARARTALADLARRWLAREIPAEAAVAEARAIRDALDAEIEAILTPEQLAELEARRAAFHPGLELTEEQRAEIRAIVDRWRVLVLETLEGLRDRTLTLEDAARALLEGRRAAHAAFCAVLEPDQLEIFPGCAAPVAG
jgi:Spy/CpxP family protein refolding chaperone